MKRRNADTGKMRRPLKRTKITEGMYGNSLLYLKFVMLWATVVMADYMLEFRFEFLWPFWMMLRSVYDSFKYQGLAFSVFFICIALTSDMICFFFIPLQYIFFAASTYVWVQYVWYTCKSDRFKIFCGILLYAHMWHGTEYILRPINDLFTFWRQNLGVTSLFVFLVFNVFVTVFHIAINIFPDKEMNKLNGYLMS